MLGYPDTCNPLISRFHVGIDWSQASDVYQAILQVKLRFSLKLYLQLIDDYIWYPEQFPWNCNPFRTALNWVPSDELVFPCLQRKSYRCSKYVRTGTLSISLQLLGDVQWTYRLSQWWCRHFKISENWQNVLLDFKLFVLSFVEPVERVV